MAISTIVAGLADIGIEGAAATIGATALEGALVGGGLSAIEGGNVLKGALLGGLTGGLGAGAGSVLDTTAGSIFGAGGALGTTGTAIVGDAIGGALAAGITGGNVLKGVEGGALSGALASAMGGFNQQGGSSSGAGTSAAPTAGGGVASAAGAAAPASVGAVDPNVVAPDVVNAPVTGTSIPGGGAGAGAGLPGGTGVNAPVTGTSIPGGGADASLLGASGGSSTIGSGNLPGVTGVGAAAGNTSAISNAGTSGDQFSAAPAPNLGGLTQSNAAASAITGTGSTPMTTTSSLSDLGVSPLAPASTLGTGDLSTILNTPVDPSDIANAYSGTAGGGGATGILGSLAKNPIADLGILGMGANLLAGNKTPAYSGQLAGAASTLASQGNQLTGYLTSGALPPGMQDQINRATSAATAQIRSMYASRGMTGSSAEQQDLQNVQLQAQAQAAQIAEQLYKQGVSDLGVSDQLYAQLMQTFNQRDQQASNAIAGFAGSLARLGAGATQQTGG